jgi:hypothetical protein
VATAVDRKLDPATELQGLSSKLKKQSTARNQRERKVYDAANGSGKDRGKGKNGGNGKAPARAVATEATTARAAATGAARVTEKSASLAPPAAGCMLAKDGAEGGSRFTLDRSPGGAAGRRRATHTCGGVGTSLSPAFHTRCGGLTTRGARLPAGRRRITW